MLSGSLAWEGRTVGDGRYRVERRLGAGGMGVVFLAHDGNLDTPVVLKVPHPHLLGEATIRERFEREVRSLVKLQHPSIVRIIDLGYEEGLPFAVLTYLGGGDLDARRPRSTAGGFAPTSPAELDTWLPTIGRALDFVHAQGLLHRDVKPGNVLFDEHGHAFLGDFGIVTLLDPAARSKQTAALTSPGGVIGTPEYLAPELIMAQASDGRGDQYALAMATYEVLAGQVPFEGATTVILLRQVQETVPPIDTVLPYASPALAEALMRGLSKNPEDRFPSCAAFADAMLKAVTKSTSRCPACNATLPLKPEHVGGRTRCPACTARLAIGPDLVVGTPGDADEPRQTVASRGAARPSRAKPTGESASVPSAASIESPPAKPAAKPTPEAPPEEAKPTAPKVRATRGPSVPRRAMLPLGGVILLAVIAGVAAFAWRGPSDKGTGVSHQTADAAAIPSPAESPEVVPPQVVPALPLVAPFSPQEAAEARQAWAVELDIEPEFENEIGMRMVLIPPGEFRMGADEPVAAAAKRFALAEKDALRYFADAHPKHRVKLTEPFYISAYETTKGQFEQFVGETQYKPVAIRTGKGGQGWNDEAGKTVGSDARYSWRNTGFPYGPDHPIVNICWIDAVAFCSWLKLETGRDYRLLKEAEWEYCCRAGTETVFPFGDDPNELPKHANLSDQTMRKKFTNYPEWQYSPHEDGYAFLAPVGKLEPNAFGVYDMLGNARELCADIYGERYYANSPVVNPNGPRGPRTAPRVIRGGRWNYLAWNCTSSERYKVEPTESRFDLGFRVALSVDRKAP